MRLFLIAFFPFLVFADSILLEPGIYQPRNGNNASICPQKVRPVIKNKKLELLKVVYVGDCYYWGPFDYHCQDNICSEGSIFFYLESDSTYHWLNSAYDIHADFTLDSSQRLE